MIHVFIVNSGNDYFDVGDIIISYLDDSDADFFIKIEDVYKIAFDSSMVYQIDRDKVKLLISFSETERQSKNKNSHFKAFYEAYKSAHPESFI
jgi:hypothetical protein